jgi:hypothetical protein
LRPWVLHPEPQKIMEDKKAISSKRASGGKNHGQHILFGKI